MTDPTPEELGDRVRSFPASSDPDAEMKDIVETAERLGEDHVVAVVNALPMSDHTTPRPPMPDDLLYPAGGGRPRYRSDDLNTTIELRLTIDGRQYLCREVLDPFMWEMQLAPNQDALESYVQHFLRKSLGGLVMDSQAMGYFRSRVFIVRPGDPHDFKRCFDSQPGQNAEMWPRCLNGLILSELPGESWVPGSGAAIRRDSIRGVCPCRCHRGRSRYLAGVWPPGVRMFQEE